MEDERIIEKSNPFGKILLIIGFLLVIGGGIYFYYVQFYNNPQYVFSKVLKKEFSVENITNNLFDTEKPFKGLGSINGSITATNKEFIEIADVFNKLNLQYDFELDKNNNLFNGNLHTKYDNKELIDLNLYSCKRYL